MRLLNYADLRDKGIKYSKGYIWRLRKQKKFPEPKKLYGGANLWTEEEIDAHIEKLLKAAEGGNVKP